jgi:hypothetical protein
MATNLNDRNGQFPELVADIGSAGQLQTMAAPASPLGQKVTAALREALAWRPRAIDPKGFVAALNSSFEITEQEGHTEWRWTPHSYAVQADIGAVTGAQASIYSRASIALDHAKPLIEGLRSLNPATDEDEAEALRSLLIAEMEELVGELGTVGGWRAPRVAGLFTTLLGPTEAKNPQEVAGLFGRLREQLKLKPEQVNSVDEEQNLTNFLIVVDHFLALKSSWENLPTNVTGSTDGDFFGTQLVQLARRLGVIVETVQQVYRIMDAVLIGAEDRQTIKLYLALTGNKKDHDGAMMPDTALTIAELLGWTERFAQEEAPQIIEEAGKEGVISFRNTMRTLTALVIEMTALAEGRPDQLEGIDELLGRPALQQELLWAMLDEHNSHLPKNLHHIGVQRSFSELVSHLGEAKTLVDSFRRVPQPVVGTITPEEFVVENSEDDNDYYLSIFGQDFEDGATVRLVARARLATGISGVSSAGSADTSLRVAAEPAKSVEVGARQAAKSIDSKRLGQQKRSPRALQTSEPIDATKVERLSSGQLFAKFSLNRQAVGEYQVVVVNRTTGDQSDIQQAPLLAVRLPLKPKILKLKLVNDLSDNPWLIEIGGQFFDDEVELKFERFNAASPEVEIIDVIRASSTQIYAYIARIEVDAAAYNVKVHNVKSELDSDPLQWGIYLHSRVERSMEIGGTQSEAAKKPSISEATYRAEGDEYVLTIKGADFRPGARVQIVLQNGKTHLLEKHDTEVESSETITVQAQLLGYILDDLKKVRVINPDDQASLRHTLTKETK